MNGINHLWRQWTSAGGWGAGLIIFLSLSAVGNAQDWQEFRQTYELNPGATISLENISGDISISSWAQPQAEVVAVKVGPRDQLDDVEISIDAQSSLLDIRTNYPRCRNCNIRVSVQYTLRVPRQVNLDTIKSVSGDIQISDIAGRVDARSVSGSVSAKLVEDEIDLQTVSGDAEATEVRGRTSVQSVSGDVKAKDITAELRAKTVSGDIDISYVSDRINAETVSGEITVVMPQRSGFQLRASTFSGSIDTDFELTNANYSDENKLSGVVGGGGPALDVRSHSGSIRIRAAGAQ